MSCLPFGIVLLTALCADFVWASAAKAQTPDYTITQITSDATDHRWPAFNTQGETVWSQQVGGFWHVFFTGGQITNGNNDHLYPDLSDASDVVYVNHGTGPGGWPPQLIKHPDTVIEFSSSNPPGCIPPSCNSWRGAGDHSGIASDGTIVWYYDFCTPSCVRRFNVTGVGQLSGDFAGRDYPDININGIIVYASGGQVYTISTTDLTPHFLTAGAFPRINDAGDIVVISGGQARVFFGPDHTTSAFVHDAVWADINNNKEIVFEDSRDGFQHIFKATPNPVITQDDQLGYFCGAMPPNFRTFVTLTATGVSAGPFTWQILNGAPGMVLFDNDSDTETTTSPSVGVKSTGGSSSTDDVTVHLTYGGGTLDKTLTVFQPKAVRRRPDLDLDDGRGSSCSVHGDQGYVSVIGYEVIDQFDNAISTGINEQFGDRTDIDTNDWPRPAATADIATNGQFLDNLCATTPLLNPNPLPPPDPPLSDRRIFKIVQQWFAGSSVATGAGCYVSLDDAVFFIDHGRHENIQSPPPR